MIYSKTGNKKARKYYLIINNSLEESENKKKYIELFIIHILRYKEHIKSNDENFFLKFEGNESILRDLSNAKEVYCSLGKEDKENVFLYLNHLVKLSEQYLVNFTK